MAQIDPLPLTYIDEAWQEHANKLEQLNEAIRARAFLDKQITRLNSELEDSAEEAVQAFPWCREVEGSYGVNAFNTLAQWQE